MAFLGTVGNCIFGGSVINGRGDRLFSWYVQNSSLVAMEEKNGEH